MYPGFKQISPWFPVDSLYQLQVLQVLVFISGLTSQGGSQPTPPRTMYPPLTYHVHPPRNSRPYKLRAYENPLVSLKALLEFPLIAGRGVRLDQGAWLTGAKTCSNARGDLGSPDLRSPFLLWTAWAVGWATWTPTFHLSKVLRVPWCCLKKWRRGGVKQQVGHQGLGCFFCWLVAVGG